MNRITRRTSLGALTAMLATPAVAQQWPSQIIRFVVPFTPGGSTDLLARILGQKLEPLLKQAIIIENRPGAGGAIAAGAVARGEPDGYTFLMGHIGTLAFNPALSKTLNYDPQRDFAPVALVATVPNILAVNPALPVTTLAEFIAYARANPGKLNYGSGGVGSAAHIAGAYLVSAAGIDAVHVPYRGTSASVNDLVAGAIQFTLTGGPAVLPLAAGGKLRAIAVSSKTRVPFAANLPTIAESGLPGFDAVQWYGLVAPAKTPAPIIARMNESINALMSDAAIVETLSKDGALASPISPEAFRAHIASEIVLWRDVIERAGITAGG